MGSSISKLIGCRKPYRIVVFGLHASGKTSLVYRLKTGTLVHTNPTIGYNSELIHLKYSDVIMYDVGGGAKIHPLWRHYYEGANGIIFVLDASDRIEAKEAAYNLQSLLNYSTNTKHLVLILANKQDKESCLTEEEIIQIFQLQNRRDIKWRIQPASIKKWYGVTEGMDWLSNELCK